MPEASVMKVLDYPMEDTDIKEDEVEKLRMMIEGNG